MQISAVSFRGGMSLMEVLISMAVLSIGLLGVASLIPLGGLALVETGKADRSGACGHAALHEIKVRRMLDPYPWPEFATPTLPNGPPQWVLADGAEATSAAFTEGAFAIDPLYVARSDDSPRLGPILRVSLRQPPATSARALPWTRPLAERVFRWYDDLQFSMPEDVDPRPLGESKRPLPADLVSKVPQAQGDYSWLVTVTPAAAEAAFSLDARTLYSVSVVVCYKRDFSPESEHTAEVDFLGGPGWGGGSVELKTSDPALRLRENEWIMLCGAASGRRICKWYRVVSADAERPTVFVSLVGPDWDVQASPSATAVAIDHVVGVYTTTVEIDRDLSWQR